MKLSIIIPCYNCEKTIERLLDSILGGGLPPEDFEIIVCDDKSTDRCMEIIKQYQEKHKEIHFTFCETTREVHCPGNTRQAALPYITGEWFTFIDNDDMFEPNAFTIAFDYIEKNNIQYTLCTNFREFDATTNKYTREITGDKTDTWLHGKFFNTENTLNKFHCHFKEDLMSHEDVYFNSSNLAKLIELDLDYVYYPVFTYKWVYNPNSLSRSYFNKKDYYIETYLDDFLIGASYPFFEMYKNNDDPKKKYFAFNQVMMTLLHGYFYYQASVWRLGNDNTLISAYNAVKDLKRKIINELGISEQEIIEYIYSMPNRYNSVKRGSEEGSNAFVEIQSFRDFIMNL
jgi:glycosyltransferase involved in cell wall biosynthesis